MIGALANHLWQSTLFVASTALLAAFLRENGADVRHRVWLVASVKFLFPFSLLMSLGGTLPRLAPSPTGPARTARTTAIDPTLSVAVDRLAQPFANDAPTPAGLVPGSGTTKAPELALVVAWLCGFVVVTAMRFRDWRRVRAALRASVPVRVIQSSSFDAAVPICASPGLIEPGVAGIWRPVLLVPAGIEAHLSPAQVHVLLVHEMCHVARRDNLTSAMHMIVEAVFWFHPLVWWVGGRLVEERERACDEHVLRVCGAPQAYAESILEVCKRYQEWPVACVSGATGLASPTRLFGGSGARLKKRVAAIMRNRVGRQLDGLRTATLLAAAMLAVALPLVAGMLIAPLRVAAFAPAPGDSAVSQATPGRFDVVSIKPCDPNTPFTPRGPAAPAGFRRGGAPFQANVSPGYAYWACATLTDLVDQAYADRDHPLLNTVKRTSQFRNRPKRVRGGPPWVESEKFTIEAKAPPDVTAAGLSGGSSAYLPTLPAAMSQALRAVLEGRFQIKVHRAIEQQDMLALTVAKGGLNNTTMVTPTPGDCLTKEEYSAAVAAGQVSRDRNLTLCGYASSARDGGQQYSSYPLNQLAPDLSTLLNQFVLDRTGIETRFNFVIKPESDAGPWGDSRRFSRALDSLGLKLEPIKAPAEYLVIDHAERPTPNAPAPSRTSGAGTP